MPSNEINRVLLTVSYIDIEINSLHVCVKANNFDCFHLYFSL